MSELSFSLMIVDVRSAVTRDKLESEHLTRIIYNSSTMMMENLLLL